MPEIPLDKHQFWFRSPLFEVEPGEDAETNPLCYGRALANWLAAALREEGVEVESVIPEDWGWCVIVKRTPFLLWVGCGNVQEHEEQLSNDALPQRQDVVWTCMVVAEVPLLKRLFRAPDTGAEVDEIYWRIKRIVTAARGTTFVDPP